MQSALARIRKFTQEMKEIQRELFEPNLRSDASQPPAKAWA
jgi:hypothetical protein